MPSRGERPKRWLAAAFLVAVLSALGAVGCALSTAGPVEEGVIEPATPAEASTDVALGPGVRPLSLGPGDKGSPRISPSGDRVAFVLDGGVVEKPLYAGDVSRRSPEGVVASSTDWLSEENLAFLAPGRGGPPAASAEADALFVVRPGDGAPVGEVVRGVEAASTQAGGSILAAVGTASEGVMTLVRVRSGGEVARRLPVEIRGDVSGLSLSPDGREVVMAVELAAGGVEISTYRPSSGAPPRRVALLEEGLEVIGAPQQTSQGIFFVAREEGDEEAGYALYRVAEGAEEYEPARAVGEDFVPASIAASPDGASLAVLGRRSTRSPTDLYVLDLDSDTLDAVTTNENMEIKTKPRDLAWSPDGSSVLIVARGVLSGPEVYGAPARELSSAFYNVYAVPSGPPDRSGRRKR